jgi:hypothetical protein
MHRFECTSFWAWAVAGCVFAFGLLVLGFLVLLPLAILIALRPGKAALGLLTGAGLPLLWVAFLNRAGPGTTCWAHGSSSGCGENLNPLPWLVLGLVLVAGGIAAFSRAQRH